MDGGDVPSCDGAGPTSDRPFRGAVRWSSPDRSKDKSYIVHPIATKLQRRGHTTSSMLPQQAAECSCSAHPHLIS